MRQSFNFLIGCKFMASERSQIMDQRHCRSVFHVCNTTQSRIIFLKRILYKQYVILMKYKRKTNHAEQFTKKNRHLSLAAYMYRQIPEPVALHQFIDIILSLIGRYYLQITIHHYLYSNILYSANIRQIQTQQHQDKHTQKKKQQTGHHKSITTHSNIAKLRIDCTVISKAKTEYILKHWCA